MKKHKKKIIFIVALAILVLTIPYLIDLQFIGSYVATKAKKIYGLNISIEKTSWNWFPSPGISIKKTVVESSEFYAEIDNIGIYPQLSSFFNGNIKINRVRVNTPKIRIKSLEALLKQTTDKKMVGEFPSLIVTVANGALLLPFDGHLKDLKGKIKPLDITDINLALDTNIERIKLSASLKTPYASDISTEMKIKRNSFQDLSENFFWDLRSNAQNIDLSQIRKILLLLFNENETVQEVFGDIVLDGSVSNAELTFKGKTSEFDELDRMVITAEVDDVKIHIPETKIYLTNSKGSIKIKDSVLTGDTLSTTLKNSFGKNGTLSLGLAEDDFQFNLGFDIDADLSEVQGIIDEFIYHPELKKQLAGIKIFTGRTSATLKLGDDLNNIKTDISLPSLSGKFHYDFLQRDITVKDGALTISPDSVSWENFTCDIGPSSITDVSGSVNLEKDSLLNLTALKAKINSSDVYNIISSWPNVKKKAGRILEGIEGDIELSDFSLSGPVNKPEAIKYGFTISSDAVTVSSPMLPNPSILSFNSVNISDEKIIINQMKASLKNSVFSVSTNLGHSLLNRFTGSMIINGVAGKELDPWIRANGWFHDSFMPKLPCNFSPLSILLTENTISITGNLLHRKKINTIVDVKVEKNSNFSGTFETLSGKEHALIRINYPEKPNNRNIKIAFDGDISKATMTAVIDNEWLPGDTLKGKFDLLYPAGKKDAINMTGSAEIKNFKLNLDKNGAALLDALKITGKNDYADLTPGELTIICPDNFKSIIKENLVVSDLSSRIYFQYTDAALLKILSGNICGVNLTGDLGIPSKKLDFKLSTGKEQQVTFDELFSCLGIQQIKITGGLSIDANIKGTSTNISGSTIKLKAVNGVVEKATLLAKILSLVDLTELFNKNPIKKLTASGYHYESIEAEAVIIGHKLHIVRAVANGSGLNLYGTGHIDLETMDIDMVVLASPLKAINSMIYSLPIIGKKFSGKNKSIISVPIKIEGKLGNPKTRFIPKQLTTVSSEIMDIFVRTFKMPFEFSYKLVKPDKKKQNTSDE